MYRIIGVASGWGAQLRACEHGPDALGNWGLFTFLQQNQIPLGQWKTIYPEEIASKTNLSEETLLSLVRNVNLKLAHEVEQALDSNEFPVVIGGDHSIAVGTWNGVYSYFRKKDQLPLGLIWIDAHMDAHTPETTPSGALHGMPVAALLGKGNPLFVNLRYQKPLLSPENICLIGVRSFEEGEAKLLRDLNVRIYFADEVKERGFKSVLREAINHIAENVKAFGVSLDLDVVTPEEAPGVGSPVSHGIKKEELLEGLSCLQNESKFKAFELVEYNPERDRENKTAELCLQILLKCLNQ